MHLLFPLSGNLAHSGVKHYKHFPRWLEINSNTSPGIFYTLLDLTSTAPGSPRWIHFISYIITLP